jgi:hypothetical protein
MGTHLGFSGSGTLPLCTWIHERLALQEDIVILENVPAFDFKAPARVLAATHDVHITEVSPTDLGHPYSRPRKIALFTKRSALGLMIPFSTDDDGTHPITGDTYGKIFFKSALMTGDAYFASKPAEVLTFYQSKATKKGLDIAQVPGGMPRSLLSGAHEMRLRAYEGRVAQLEVQGQSGLIVNLEQNCDRFWASRSRLPRFLPCLLRNFTMWSMGVKRELLPDEALCATGVPAIGILSSWANHSLAVLLEQPASIKRSLVGNSMHLGVINSVIVFSLACTKQLCSSSPSRSLCPDPGHSDHSTDAPSFSTTCFFSKH